MEIKSSNQKVVGFRKTYSVTLQELSKDIWNICANVATYLLPNWCSNAQINSHAKTTLLANFLRLSTESRFHQLGI